MLKINECTRVIGVVQNAAGVRVSVKGGTVGYAVRKGRTLRRVVSHLSLEGRLVRGEKSVGILLSG